MKPSLLSAFFLSVLTLACGASTEPVREPVPAPVPAGPTAVVILAASANHGSVTITFTQTYSAAAASIEYQVSCQSNGGKYTGTGKASPITISGLTDGIRYSCTVTAIDANGTSDPSPAVVVTPGSLLYKPSMMYLLSPGNGSATIAYELPSEFLMDARPWFVAVTCNAAGVPPTTMASAESVVRAIAVTGLQNGVLYSCFLSITSESGGAISAPLSVMPGTPMRPLAPTATPGNASVTLSFEASVDNGFPITGYTATCVATGQESRTVNGTSSPLVVSGLANGVAYSCNVYGSNSFGAGEKSASMPVTPGIPTAVKSITVTTTSNSATFSFSPPDSDNGSRITSYTVTCDPSGPSPSTTSTGSASPITLTGLLVNWSYDCAIFATNANGNGAKTYFGVSTKP